MSIACLQSEINTKYERKLAAMFESQISNLLLFAHNGCFFKWGAYFCMGAYKCDVVVVMPAVGAYIHGVLILCGCLLSRFYGMRHTNTCTRNCR